MSVEILCLCIAAVEAIRFSIACWHPRDFSYHHPANIDGEVSMAKSESSSYSPYSRVTTFASSNSHVRKSPTSDVATDSDTSEESAPLQPYESTNRREFFAFGDGK